MQEETLTSVFTKEFVQDIEYGSALNIDEKMIVLKTDISKPNNTKLHPLFICNHGGGGFKGDKAGGMHPIFDILCTNLGVTVAYPNYRLGDATMFKPASSVADCTKWMWEEMYRSLEDNYALIRYLLKHNDVYHIDPMQIWIGGVSYGAVMGIQCVHWQKEEYENVVDIMKWKNNSNTDVTTPFNIAGCISLSGAIFTEADIDPTDKVIIQWYGLLDTTLRPLGGVNHKCPYVGPEQIDADSNFLENKIYTLADPKAAHCGKVPGNPLASIQSIQAAKMFFLNSLKQEIH